MKVETIKEFLLHDDRDIPDGNMCAIETADSVAILLAESDYSPKAINYYLYKPHLRIFPDTDIVTECTEICGDRLILNLNISERLILDVKFQVTGYRGGAYRSHLVVGLIQDKYIVSAAFIDVKMFPTCWNRC